MPASAGAASIGPQTGVKCVDLEIVGQEMWGSDEQRWPLEVHSSLCPFPMVLLLVTVEEAPQCC